MSSEKYLTQFINDHSLRLAKGTLEGYETSVRQLLAFYDKSFHQITRKDIRNWLTHLEENHYQLSTIKTKLLSVKQFYKYCVEEGHLSQNPVASIMVPKVDEKLPTYLEHIHLTQLRQLVKDKKEERAIIEVFYATGVRLRELTAIRKEDINWSERFIHIPEGKRKKARIVLFTRACAEHLEAYLKTRSDTMPYLFLNTKGTERVSHRAIQFWFEAYAEKLGIRLTPHTLRHTFAAHLAMKGMPLPCIQVLLGHTSHIQTQLYARLYNHARKEMYDEWM